MIRVRDLIFFSKWQDPVELNNYKNKKDNPDDDENSWDFTNPNLKPRVKARQVLVGGYIYMFIFLYSIYMLAQFMIIPHSYQKKHDLDYRAEMMRFQKKMERI